MHASGLQAQARFCSAVTAGKSMDSRISLSVQLAFQMYILKNLTDQAVLANYLFAPSATGIFSLLVGKTLEGKVGPKEEENLSLPVLQQTEANEDAHCLCFTNCALG